MNYLTFRKIMFPFQIFSIQDIIKNFPDFDRKRLVEWQKKGYLKKLVNRWYFFNEIQIDDILLYRMSNCVYRPSYISLESALAYYHFIPEGVYQHQSVTTRKTKRFETPVGVFNYRNIKEKYFFGYTILHNNGLPVMIAETEKALLDYLYLSPIVKTVKDLEALRFNVYEIKQKVNWEKLQRYAQYYKSKVMNKKIQQLQKLIHNVSAE